MTNVEFWRQGDRDAWNEYQEIKAADPAMGRAIRDAITLVAKDPDIAQRNYSRSLDPSASQRTDVKPVAPIQALDQGVVSLVEKHPSEPARHARGNAQVTASLQTMAARPVTAG